MKIDGYVKRKIRRAGYDRSVLPDIAEEYYKKIMLVRNEVKPPTCIYDVYDMLTERTQRVYQKPYWLKPYILILEDIINNGKVNRVVFSAAARHSKTLTAKISLVFACMVLDGKDHIYVTYNQNKADVEQREFISLLDDLGIKYFCRRDKVWVVPLTGKNKNCVRFTSVEGKITGTNLTGIIFIDDVIGEMREATSPTRYTLIQEFFDRQVLTRGKRFSLVVMNTRWNKKDLIQMLIDRGYPYLRIPAICDNEETDPLNRKLGEPLWKEEYPIEELMKIKNELDINNISVFPAMYQGLPGSDELLIVKNITKYSDRMVGNIIYSYGIDLAYSGKNGSDFSVIVCIETSRDTGISHISRCYRRQCYYTDFIEDCKTFIRMFPGNLYFCAGGIESYSSGEAFKRAFGGRMRLTNSTQNKLTKFQDSGALTDFNSGMLRIINSNDKDIKILEEQILSFTGRDLGPGTDDYIDAISAAYISVKDIKNSVGIQNIPKHLITKPEIIQDEFVKQLVNEQKNKVQTYMPNSYTAQKRKISF